MRGRLIPIVLIGTAAVGAVLWLVAGRTAEVPAPVPPAPVSAPAPATPSLVPRGAAPEPAKPRAVAPKTTTGDPSPAPAVAAAPTTGTLHIVADVADASVFIDRKFVGTAPVTASDIAPGPHRLNVSAAGYDAVAEDIDVAPGPREITIKLKEIRLAATVAVTHKHAAGSCTGTLRASPQGVTYDTTNTNDAFTVALTDIETFEVKYLDKNLKLKIKKGKSYNFTDPEGNADRLFVFHRDVEKARQRLAGGGVK